MMEVTPIVGVSVGRSRTGRGGKIGRRHRRRQRAAPAALRILAISDPENPKEVGFFDTVTAAEDVPGFAGSWSNYPYFRSGSILVSSMREGLFILKKRTTVF